MLFDRRMQKVSNIGLPGFILQFQPVLDLAISYSDQVMLRLSNNFKHTFRFRPWSSPADIHLQIGVAWPFSNDERDVSSGILLCYGTEQGIKQEIGV